MDARKIRHLISKIVQIVMCAYIFVHIIPIPIKKVYRAKEIKLGTPSYLEDCTIEVTGYYHFNVFQNDIFKGMLVLSNNHMTEEPIRPLSSPGHEEPLQYDLYAEKPNEFIENRYYDFGLLFREPMMRNICIMVYDNATYDRYGNMKSGAPSYSMGGSWSPFDSYCIVASVNSRQEALEKLYRYGIISTSEGR